MSMVAAVVALTAMLAALWWFIVWMPGRSHAGAFEPLLPHERVSAARLEADVRRLATEIGERSAAKPQGLAAAADHIEQTFRGLGYAVTSHEYESRGARFRNVEATSSATTASEIVLVGAHYDSLVGTTGANDNASGVAAMLEIARLLAGKPLARTVRFVGFVNEEPPYFNVGEMGSQFYASAAAARGDRIVAMIALETLGYYSDAPGSQHYPFPFGLFYPTSGSFVAFVGNLGSRPLVHRGIAAFRRSVRFPSEGVAAPAWIPGVSWSDHASFWTYGYPAMMVTDTAPYRYPHYHTVTDVPEHVDSERLARVVHGLAGTIIELADRP